MKKTQVQYKYHSFDDDVVFTKNQSATVPQNFIWIHSNIFYRFFSGVVYWLAVCFAFFYCHFYLKVNFKNRKSLKNSKGGFVFANHTQPLGDVLIPMLAAFPNRAYTIAESSNLGIPFVRRILTMGGALIIPQKISQIKEFEQAISFRIKQHRLIFIYPEAHVWPYFTKIRPFSAVSFHYPQSNNSESFCMTTTYQKGWAKKPKAIIYLDGPFLIDNQLKKKPAREKLYKQIYEKMAFRSQNSNISFIKYLKI